MGCIIISAEKSPVTENEAKVLGIDEYLVKPFIIEELESAINHIMETLPKTDKQASQPSQSQKIRISALEKTAIEYMREGRTDSEATQVFEKLAEDPNCDTRWLEALAMIYAVQQEWGKLKSISVRLEQKKNK